MTHANENMNHENLQEVLPSFGKTAMPYQLPNGYFDGLADDILAQVQIQSYSKEEIFAVPPGYFESFAYNVLNRIKNEPAEENEVLEELRDIAPLLTTISRENMYTVPANYFEKFTVNTGAKSKVVSIDSNKSKKNTWRGLAVAASLLGAVLTLGLLVNKEENTASLSQSNTAYASVEGVSRDSGKPNAQNLGAYLNNPSGKNEVKDAKIVVPQDIKVIDVSNEINTISSQDLEEYLNSTPAIN